MKSSSALDCTVIGDAMVDIVARIESRDSLDRLFESGLMNTDISVIPGGSANVAAGIADLGGRSGFVGKVGKDAFGELIREDLEAQGIESCLSVSRLHKTGLVFDVILEDGERLFVVDRGANADLKPRDIDTELILRSSCLYFVGYSLQDATTANTVRDMMDLASENEKIICFSPGAPILAKSIRGEIVNLIESHVDVVFANEEEAMNLSNSSGKLESVSFLQSLGPKTVVLTRGRNGCIVHMNGETYEDEGLSTHAADATGAGDAFAAAFLHANLKGWDVERVLSFSNEYAKRVVERIGGRMCRVTSSVR